MIGIKYLDRITNAPIDLWVIYFLKLHANAGADHKSPPHIQLAHQVTRSVNPTF